MSRTGSASRGRPPGKCPTGLPTPFARRARGWLPGLALLLLSSGLLLWSLGLGSAAGAPERDDLEELRRRLEAGDVESVATEVDRRLSRLDEGTASGASRLTARTRRADLLDLRVETYWRGGEIHSPEAWRLARSALDMRERLVGPDHPDLLPSLDNLGILNAERGDYARAAHFFGRALEIRRRALPGTAELGRGLYRLGNLHQLEGELIEARALYEESLEVTRRALGPEDVQVANILDALGVVERALGHRETARRLNRASLELRERLQGPDHIDLAYSLYHLGELAMTSGDTREALALLRRALAIDRGALGPDHPLVATDLQGLAVVHHELGNGARARELLSQALDIRRRVLGPDHPMVGESSTYLAMLLLEAVEPGDAPGRSAPGPDTADTVRAEALLSRAVGILEASLGEDHRLTVESLTGLAAVHWLQGRWAQAVEEALEAEDRARHHFFRTAHSLTQDEALRLRPAAVSSGLDIALTALASPVETAWAPPAERVWGALVRSRGVVMDEMVRRRRFMRRGAPEEVRRKAVRLAASRDRLERLLTRDLESVSPEAHRQRLERARRELEEAERALAAVTLLHHQPRAETAGGPSLADVRRALPPGATLVAYATYRRLTRPGILGDGLTPGPRERSVLAYMALVLPPDGGEPRAVPLGDARTIEALVAEWQRQVAVPDRDLHGGPGLSPALARAGEALRHAVWDPLAPSLADAELVLVVPDGVLHRVSLATLPAPSPPREGLRAEPEPAERYLVETGPPIHYLSTERDLIRHRDRQPAGRGLLVVGAPQLEPGTRLGGPCPGDPGLELASLPGSLREVQEVAALWHQALGAGREGDVARLTGPRAREEALADEAEGRRVVHLASHGFVRSEPCAASEDQPLLASGLVLSGPPATGREGSGSEDGILYAEELAALDLRGVEWVVLSACETGLGPVEGREGVLGLRRALETSGAETLIMSLWKVQDRATREWMGALYRKRLAGASTATAVQAASRGVIEARRREGRSDHPFFWGAFVASGGWR